MSASTTTCQHFKTLEIEETNAPPSTRRDQISLLKFHERALQVVETQLEPFCNNSALHSVGDNARVVTFFCVEVRDGQQESRDATDRVPPIYARQKIAAVSKLPLNRVCVPVLGADIVLHKIGERRQREALHMGCDKGSRAVDLVIKVP